MLVFSFFNSPFGLLKVEHDEHYLYTSAIVSGNAQPIDYPEDKRIRAMADSIHTQIHAYLTDSNYRFQLPFKLNGSAFQRSVWNALTVIPSGQTVTYGQLAHRLNTSPRAVGQACKTNPLPLFIPCHRVIAQNGIGGFMGKNAAISIKKALLTHELKEKK